MYIMQKACKCTLYKTRAAALNHVFTCTQCTVYVQYMCKLNSMASVTCVRALPIHTRENKMNEIVVQ